MENGKWGMGNGEWEMGNRKWGMENGEWGMDVLSGNYLQIWSIILAIGVMSSAKNLTLVIKRSASDLLSFLRLFRKFHFVIGWDVPFRNRI